MKTKNDNQHHKNLLRGSPKQSTSFYINKILKKNDYRTNYNKKVFI